MYLALISGYTEVMAIEKTEEQAKEKAIKEKRKLAEDCLNVWTWEECEEYFGANVYELLPGTVIIDREMKGERKC